MVDTSKYQIGGWYEGKQWNGTTLGPVGVENMPGREGIAVNPEVIKAQGNTEYIAQQKAIEAKNNGGVAGVSPTGTTTNTQVSDLQKQIDDTNKTITDKKSKANEAIAMVNENPFLSESNRVGRIQKINTNLNNDLLVDQQQLSTLTTKQTALKPETVATTETDENGNVTQVITNKLTGEIISKTNLGKIGAAQKQSEVSRTESDNKNRDSITQTLYSNANSYGNVPPNVFNAGMAAFVNAGLGTSTDYLKAYSSLIDPNRTDWGGATGYNISKEQRNELFPNSLQ